jgi:glyoxalase family protein
MISGLHHITAISSDPKKNYDFYTKVLGVRFIKKTVNFDNPYTYHLYFGDEIGTPGSALTFFPYVNSPQGRRGAGQTLTIAFQIPKESLRYWFERFVNLGVKHEKIQKRFGESYIRFYDNDGLQMELMASDDQYADFRAWKDSPVPVEHQIRGFHSVSLGALKPSETEKLIIEFLEYEKFKEEEKIIRFKNKNAKRARYIDIVDLSTWTDRGINSVGTVHHIAFNIYTDKSQKEII